MRKFGYASAAMAAIAAASIGVWRVYADEGYSDEIGVTVRSLATNGITIYTPDGELQEIMPIGVDSALGREKVSQFQTIAPALRMDVTTGGSIELTDGVPDVVDPLESIPATLTRYSAFGSLYYSVIDASQLEYTEENVGGGITGLVAQDFLRALAVAESYYFKGETVTDVAEDMLDITVLDADLVDADTNGIPDATALLEPFTLMMGPNGNITMVTDLGSLDDRGSDQFDNGNVEIALRSEDGPLRIRVNAPTMNELAAANAAYNLYAGRLIVTVANDARDLIDIPQGTDPAADFDLDTPEPRGLFVRTVIALTDAVDLRGTVPQWTFLDTLPDDLEVRIEIGGPPVQEQLNAGDAGFAYMYVANAIQQGEDILIDADPGYWTGLPNLEIVNEFTDEITRGNDTSVDTGDDTLIITFEGATGIYASNLMPELRSGGGGGGGHCFIATAAYGTPMAAEIQSLRDVRDVYLIDTALGAAFVDTYYRLSPPIARVVSEYPAAKVTVRALLAPVVAASGWTMVSPGTVAVGVVAMLIAVAAARRRFVRVAVREQ